MLNVPVVMLVAAAAVLAGVVYVATGRGGELAFFQPDYAPLKLDEVTSTDVALFRPPAALWGYSMQATDEALSRIANAITERDIEISALQQRVADLEAATARRRAYARPENPPGRAERPSRPERPARPPEPDVIGTAAAGQDTAPPERAARPDEPRQEPPDEPDGRDIWRPASRAGRPGAEPGDGAAPPTLPWSRRATGADPARIGWASLPKRPRPSTGDDEDSR